MALSVKTYKMKQINPTGMSSFLSMKIDGCFKDSGKNNYLFIFIDWQSSQLQAKF